MIRFVLASCMVLGVASFASAQCIVLGSTYSSCQSEFGAQVTDTCSGCTPEPGNPGFETSGDKDFSSPSSMPSSVWSQLRHDSTESDDPGASHVTYYAQNCGNQGTCANRCEKLVDGGVEWFRCYVNGGATIPSPYVVLSGACVYNP